MREIKFRAWDKINKQMLQHNQISVLLKNIGNNNQWEYMQFTGLLDKNGKEIYEGDICIYYEHHPEVVGSRPLMENDVIAWDKKEGCWCWGKCWLCNCNWRGNLEVVGDIHSSPKLLETK